MVYYTISFFFKYIGKKSCGECQALELNPNIQIEDFQRLIIKTSRLILSMSDYITIEAALIQELKQRGFKQPSVALLNHLPAYKIDMEDVELEKIAFIELRGDTTYYETYTISH